MAKTCRFLIFFLILAVALVIWHGNRTAIEIKDVVVQFACLVMVALSALSLLSKDKILINKDPLVMLVAVYGVLMTIAYLLTNRSSLNYQTMMPQLCGIVIFMLTIHYFDKKDIGTLIRCSVAVGVITSFYGLLQYFHLDPLNWEHIGAFGTLRVVSFFGNKNYFAIFLLLMIPLGGCVALTSQKKVPIIAGTLSTVLMITALALSYSKGAFVSFFLAVMVFGLLLALRRTSPPGVSKLHFDKRAETRLSSLKKLGFCIPLVLMLIMAMLSQDIRKDYAKRFKLRDHYVRQRLSYYQAAFEIIRRYPFMGVGPGHFSVSYPQNETYRVSTYDPDHVLNHVHNDFLEIWVEYGLFSLFAYLGVLFLFARKWLREFRNAADPNQQLGLVLIGCSLTGYLFYSMLTVAGRYMSSVFFFWLVMGIGYLCLKQMEDEKAEFVSIPNSLRGKKKISWIVAVTIALIFGFACKKMLANYVSDVYITRAYDFVGQGKYDNALQYLDRAIGLQPGSVEAYYQRGFVLFSKSRIDQAIQDYQKVNEMVPNYVNVNFNLASCFYQKQDWANAIDRAEVSHRCFPDYLPAMIMLAYGHYQIGEHQKSLAYCNQILKRYKGHAVALNLRKKLEGILNEKEENYGNEAESSYFNPDRTDSDLSLSRVRERAGRGGGTPCPDDTRS